MRPLGIPIVRDRVVQQALKNVLEPIFEEIFIAQSHGYRPNTGAHEAVRKAESYLEAGYHWVVDADIKGFFDHVDHQLLMDLVCEKVSDGRVLSLIESFLTSGVMNEGIFEASTEGTPHITYAGIEILLDRTARKLGSGPVTQHHRCKCRKHVSCTGIKVTVKAQDGTVPESSYIVK